MATAKSPTPNFPFQLTPETAACLQDILCASDVHAKNAAEEGFYSLQKSFKKIEPFYLALCNYVNTYLK